MTVIKQVKINKTQLKDNINTTIRHEQIHNNEPTNDLKIDVLDIDTAIKWHLENVIKFRITKTNNEQLTVPVLYANPEKWVSMQANGVLRDNGDKLIVPLVAFSRTGIEYRDDYRKNEVIKTEENRWLFEKRYSSKNKYTPFGILNNITPIKEYYSVDLPRYVILQYTLICWADYMQNLNEMVQQLLYFNGTAFGNERKFTTMIDAPSIEMSNNIGDDRYVKATFNLRVKGYILNQNDGSQPAIKKLVAPNKILLNFKESDNLIDSYSITSKKYNQTLPVSSTPNLIVNSEVNNKILIYLNTNIIKHATVTSINSVILLNTSILEAPENLPPTNNLSFTYFINGQHVSATAVNMVVSGNNIIYTFDLLQLGYELESDDEVLIIGKFSSE